MAGTGEKDTAQTANQDDDYIAQLLAKDARDCSLRYSAAGMYASASPRPAGRVPKPNTRFLKNVLRDTDAHNANLKRKEDEEARERMRRLRQASSQRPKTDNSREKDDKRQSKRRRVQSPREHTQGQESTRSHRSKHRDERKEFPEKTRNRDAKPRKHERTRDGAPRSAEPDDEVSSKTTRREHRRSENDPNPHARRRHSKRDDSRERTRDVGSMNGSEKRHSRRSRHSSRSRSPRRKRSRSRDHPHRGSRRRSAARDSHSHRPTPTAKTDKSRGVKQPRSPTPTIPEKDTRPAEAESPHDPDSEDDPLSNLIGPLPPSASDSQPIRCRGRGAYKPSGSNIDSHFAAGYDPSLDVHLNDDEDEDEARITSKSKTGSRRPVPGLTTDNDDIDNDWDMALEALRDRAVWRRRGAERLRQAGFEDNVVERWSNSSNFMGLRNGLAGADCNNVQDVQDADLADMRWAKKGEGREWDRGKVVDDEGHVEVKAPW